MNCFYHTDAVAVGICHHCNKGLCKECYSDLGFALACKGKHEENVIATNRLIKYNTQPQKQISRGQWFWPTFYTFMGAVFVYYGYPKGVGHYSTVLGAGFMVAGIGLYIYQKILDRKFLKEYNT